MTWKNPKTITGPPAEGDKYLKRPKINKLFWESILKGEHVRFTAPRRVGKSSVMKDLEIDHPERMIVIYQNIEADRTSQEFYKRLWTLIVGKLDGISALRAIALEWIKGRRLGEVSWEGSLKIEKQDLDYKTELLALVKRLGSENYKIVMLLDEFPDVIVSIIKNEGAEVATEVLHTLRTIRHDGNFKNFALVLAGSIGLEHVIASIDRPKLINDLKPISIPALEVDEAKELFNIQLAGATMKVGEKERKYIIEKVKHLMPYYLQLIIECSNEIAFHNDNPEITEEIIDKAFENVVLKNENFSDWEKRLQKYLEESDYNFCIGLLTRCAHQKFTIQEAYAFSKKIIPITGYKELIDDVLVKDGYLVNEYNELKFLSPFLLAWWCIRHPKFEIED